MKRLVIAIIVLGSLASCQAPAARKPISWSSGSFIRESAERNKQLNAEQHELIKSLIEKDTANHYVSSPHGFWYYYNQQVEKDTIQPKFGDIVTFEYNVKDLKDRLIYSKESLKPQRYAMDQEELFSGLREGLKIMKPGETATFLFPSQKAYGYYGDENRIGTNVPLKCEVTVHTITKNQSN